MIKKLAKSIREYKLPSIITLILMVGEAAIECFIPSITANLINNISDGVPVSEIAKTGVLLVGLAVISLCCGGTAGLTCAKASAGFAKNLRQDLFTAVQSFSFENIDKFSSSSLVLLFCRAPPDMRNQRFRAVGGIVPHTAQKCKHFQFPFSFPLFLPVSGLPPAQGPFPARLRRASASASAPGLRRLPA